MIAPGSGSGLQSEDIAPVSFPISQVTILWFSAQLLRDGCAFVLHQRPNLSGCPTIEISGPEPLLATALWGDRRFFKH